MLAGTVFAPLMMYVVIFFELAGVAVILGGFVLAVWRAGRRLTLDGDAFELLRATFGRSILLGLEILIAADLVRTLAVELTLRNLAILGILITIRTVLALSLEVEIEGRWPWRRMERVAPDR